MTFAASSAPFKKKETLMPPKPDATPGNPAPASPGAEAAASAFGKIAHPTSVRSWRRVIQLETAYEATAFNAAGDSFDDVASAVDESWQSGKGRRFRFGNESTVPANDGLRVIFSARDDETPDLFEAPADDTLNG